MSDSAESAPKSIAPLSSAQVRKVADLARLAITDEQVEGYREKLGAVLGYVDRLRSLDLADVEPMSHPMDATNRVDPDEPGPTLTNADVMRLAPESMPPYIKVPKVLGEGGGA